MAAVSVVRKLQRCERINGRDDYQVVKYKIKIKEKCASSSSSPTCISSLPFSRRALAELTDSLIHVVPATAHNDNQDTPFFSSPFCFQEHHLLHPHHHKLSTSHPGGGSGFPSLPLKLQTETLQGLGAEDSCNPNGLAPACEFLHDDDEDDSSLGAGSKSPCKLHETRTKKINGSLMLEQIGEEDGTWAMFPCKLKLQQPKEGEKSRAGEEDNEEVRRTGGASKSPWKPQEKKEEAAAPWKLRQKEKKKKEGKRKEWEVRKVECECCGMEEEYTRGYEERVRGELCGHWLCGLCEEAVREERQRLGGRVGGEISLQVALQTHMEPCRGFSRRARAKDVPPPSAMAVPHAVCRLLRRHLSTPSPSPRPRPSSLPRSSSCLPSFPSN